MTSAGGDTDDASCLLLRATSRQLDPRELQPGHDAVLSLAVEQGCSLPHGVLIDDHLDLRAREEVDRVAHAALESWRRSVDHFLTIGPICLSDIWQSELYAEVFLSVARIIAGVKATVTASGVERVACDGLDAQLVDALRAHLAPVTVHPGAFGPTPSYPGEDAAPAGTAARRPTWQRLVRRVIDGVGVPSLAHGDVLVIPYLSTLSILERLADAHGPRPVLFTAAPPNPPLALRVARRGGWVGAPSRRSRHRARREARRCLAIAAQAQSPEIAEPGTARLMHSRALHLLADRALETTAVLPALQSLFAERGVRAVVLPFDHEPLPKTIVRMAQRAGVPTLFVQHGYEPHRVFHTGTLAEFAAVWSEADRKAFPSDRGSRVRVVGNPRKDTLTAALPRSVGGPPVAVVLAEHHIRQSAILDRRITAAHLTAAIEGLRSSAHEWRIIVRPHPSDDVAQFHRMITDLGAKGVEVDGDSRVIDLLGRADLCIGALSTATLEAARMGARVVMLNLDGISWNPPLQQDGPVPTARDAQDLARTVDDVMSEPESAGTAALVEALGVGPEDPAGQVIAWLTEIIEGRGGGDRRRQAKSIGRAPARSGR